MRGILIVAMALSMGCRKPPPEASDQFNDAVVALFVQFEEPDDVVAENLLVVERQVYLGMDVEADSPKDRALEPRKLLESDISHVDERPRERDIAMALPISVAGVSPHDIELHKTLQTKVDHRPWEPYSPDHYVRSFTEGRDCWESRGCVWMSTWNELTKDNALMTVEYAFYKDFRWIDVAEDGGDPRWAYIARSWTPKSYAGDSEKAFIHQSYTIEVWLPRDGRGYQRTKGDTNANDGEWTSDSSGGGVLRMLALWSETEFIGLNVTDDAVIITTRNGIDKNFQAGDDYLSEL